MAVHMVVLTLRLFMDLGMAITRQEQEESNRGKLENKFFSR